jgi:pimeloyl-ACP methyl ester carboxylesterase
VVLLHGRGHAATTWWPLLGPLAERRRTVAFDLPGFGHSAARPWTGGGPRDALRFFTAPLAAVLRDLDLQGSILVGHSLGGLVALEIALGGLACPRALVLLDAMGLAPSVHPRARLYYRADPERLARWRGPIARAVEAARGGAVSRAEALRRELLEVRGGRPDAARAFEAMVPLLGAPFHLGADLGRVTVPTLLLWGARDEAFPPSVAEAAVRALPRGELRILDAGHSPHVERPHEVLAAVDDFVARLSRRAE